MIKDAALYGRKKKMLIIWGESERGGTNQRDSEEGLALFLAPPIAHYFNLNVMRAKKTACVPTASPRGGAALLNVDEDHPCGHPSTVCHHPPLVEHVHP